MRAAARRWRTGQPLDCTLRLSNECTPKNDDQSLNHAQMPCTCGLVLQISMGRAVIWPAPVNIRDFNHTVSLYSTDLLSPFTREP